MVKMSNNQQIIRGCKTRDFSIDILKCIAALLITWSHMEKPLGNYAVLATGGSLGDSLFFFCSGYTLFLSNRGINFFNWYKNRINRIYPTVLVWALILCIFFNSSKNLLEVLVSGGGWFISYIMIFYILFYPIKKYASSRLGTVLITSVLLTGCGYMLVDHSIAKQENAWLYSSFFCVMLLGGIVGKIRSDAGTIPFLENKAVFQALGMALCFIGYFGLTYIEELYDTLAWLRAVNIIVISGFAYFLFLLCNTLLAKRCYENKYGHGTIMIIGGLCLEIYLVQAKLLTDRINYLFPLNIAILCAAILFSAYLLRCLSRLWSQTFKDELYDWKRIVKLY